jgi:hypothetical protein
MHMHVFSFLMFICSFIGASKLVCSSIIGGSSIDAFLSFSVLLYNSMVISLIVSLVLVVACVFFGCFCKFPFLAIFSFHHKS